MTGVVKLALEAGKATPAPPVGPALGAKGVNIMAFCKDYNARTADKPGYIIPVEITVYDVSSLTYLSPFPFLIHVFISNLSRFVSRLHFASEMSQTHLYDYKFVCLVQLDSFVLCRITMCSLFQNVCFDFSLIPSPCYIFWNPS